MLETYTVHIESANAKILFRGKILRTPVICNKVFLKELDGLKLQAKSKNLKYKITADSELEDNFLYKEQTVIPVENNEVKIEELYDSTERANSIIESLLREEKG